LEIKGEWAKYRASGCGRYPAYRPILRNANIWQIRDAAGREYLILIILILVII
jgi:hypothetical protein